MRQQFMGAIAIAEREQIAQGYATARDMEQDRSQSRASIRALSQDRTPEVELER
jgi:hypothetical protein